MTKKIFIVKDWLPQSIPSLPKEAIESSLQISTEKLQEVENLILELEKKKVDITSSYDDWRNIGFAFASEFEESGREFFLRISSFHPEFNLVKVNKQYDYCLKSNGSGINLKTVFYLAKNAGVEISKNKVMSENPSQNIASTKLPTIPDFVYSTLPEFLKQLTTVAESNEERDLLLLGSVVTLSATMPTVYGIYHKKKVFANLYLFISAQASAGKGRLNHCRELVKPIHESLKELNRLASIKYSSELSDFLVMKKKDRNLEKPQEPPLQLLLLPANSSSSGFFQLLNDNNGRGLLFETEGDTLSNTFKSDFGNYSDGFRKAFHHETISYYRKTNKEFVDLENPCISTVLSGTPKQVLNLIPSAEDGLFSRFLFYFMNVNPTWADVFSGSSENSLDDLFYKKGLEYFQFYQSLIASNGIKFSLKTHQQIEFNQLFERQFQNYLELKGDEYIGTVRRLGLITFRIAMIFSVLRLLETGELPETILCEEEDFKASMAIAETLIVHASHIFSQLPDIQKFEKKLNKKERFLESLPQSFNRQEYLEVAIKFGINDKTAQAYIADFKTNGLIHHDSKDAYLKV